MDYQLDFFKGAPDEEAIKMIQYYEPLALQYDPRGYCVCTSEGKDSSVLGHLFRRAGVKHFYMHSITGIDPPELIYFQREKFAEYKSQGYLTYDVMYRKSLWRMMIEKTIPPIRTIRYCCAELKERRVEEQGNALLSFGVRRYESVKRKKNRRELEIVANGRRGKNIVLPFDNDENRRTFEICYADCEKRLNPIAEWDNQNVWDYINYWKLEQCCLYKEGFPRLGCIGCPMTTEANKRKEFRRWPKYRQQYLWTFNKMIEERKRRGMPMMGHSSAAEEWFEWWVKDRLSENKDEQQLELELKKM